LKHLHAVLHNDDDEGSSTSMKTELEALASSSDNTKQVMTSGKNEYLRMSYISER